MFQDRNIKPCDYSSACLSPHDLSSTQVSNSTEIEAMWRTGSLSCSTPSEGWSSSKKKKMLVHRVNMLILLTHRLCRATSMCREGLWGTRVQSDWVDGLLHVTGMNIYAYATKGCFIFPSSVIKMNWKRHIFIFTDVTLINISVKKHLPVKCANRAMC